jgi:serine/threonine protein phosphatase 1
MSIEISKWREAPTRTNETTVFAVGDIHGCVGQLRELLVEIANRAAQIDHSTLVFLGDQINRGPHSLGALAEWASDEHVRHHNVVHRLFGNHEQLMMIAAGRLEGHEEALAKFIEIGGSDVIEELRSATSTPDAALSENLVRKGAGDQVWERLQKLQCHACVGNLVFVHAGIDPAVGVSESLQADWKTFNERHWAWIKDPFLKHREGFGGQVIIHGHTPPWSHRESSGYSDPHIIQHDRLCLDGGTAKSGIVMGAQIEDGRYRLIASRR